MSTWSTSNLWQVIKTSQFSSWLVFCFVLGFLFVWGELGVFCVISKKATEVTSAQDACTGSDVLEHLSNQEFCFQFIHASPSNQACSPLPWKSGNPMTLGREGEGPGLTLCDQNWPVSFYFLSGICWLPHPAASVWRRVGFVHGRYQQRLWQDWCL